MTLIMIYYNIHTHQLPEHINEKAIVSLNLREHFSLEKNFYYSAGIHPWYADKEMLDKFYSIAIQSSVVAIGEAGLDKLTDTPLELQKEIFLIQINFAEELQKPLIIHCVKAWQELIAIYKKTKPSIPWIIHGFRGKGTLAKQLLETGFYLSFGQYYQPEAAIEAWNHRQLYLETDDHEINIQTVYASISSTLNVPSSKLSEVIMNNLQKWPNNPF